jgi:hypothetical protein
LLGLIHILELMCKTCGRACHEGFPGPSAAGADGDHVEGMCLGMWRGVPLPSAAGAHIHHGDHVEGMWLGM